MRYPPRTAIRNGPRETRSVTRMATDWWAYECRAMNKEGNEAEVVDTAAKVKQVVEWLYEALEDGKLKIYMPDLS